MEKNSITLFAVLDIRKPFVAWEAAIGRVQSPGVIEPTGFGVSLWHYNRLRDLAIKRSPLFGKELRLENVRRRNYPEKVSRLRGLYFFETEEDAHSALRRWRWYELEPYISEVTFFPTSLSRHDSEWITNYFASNPDEEWMQKYWNGDTAGVKPLMEVLALGTGIVENKTLRIQAYKRILEVWPTSTPLLATASCAFAAGLRDVAATKPGLLAKDGKVVGSFYIYMQQFDANQPAVIAAVEDCRKRGEFPPIQLPADQAQFFTLPDMRSERFEIENSELLEEFSGLLDET